jgi:7-carboxy-7-deazaguanine synthase
MTKLIISEIFYSIQGEGPNIGKPAVFLRLMGCNLKCEWCDTKYAITSTSTSSSTSYSAEQVLKKIKSYPCKHLVITGGEPLLQQEKLVPLLKKLKGWYIELETNGTIPLQISDFIEQINCSPKLKNSKNCPYGLKISPKNDKVIYKFVAQNKADLKEIRQYILDNSIPRHKVYLMPEGVNTKVIQERSKWIIEACKKENYNFSPRLHVMLWGNKRGF